MARYSAGKTTEAVRVGTTRTGKFGSRVGGVAGRTETGGRSGLTDAAVSAGSKAHGRSAPGTGVGGYGGGSGGGGVVETTTYPGGYDFGDPYADPGEGGGSDPIFEDPGDPTPAPSVTPITKAPPSIKRTAAPTAPRTSAPRTTAPRTTTPAPRSTSTPFVTPIGGQYAPTAPRPAPTTAYQGIPYTAPRPAAKPKAPVVASKSTAGKPQPKVVVQPKKTVAAPAKKKVASSTKLVAS